MKKKTIEDIRVYKSESKNEYGGYITHSFADKKLNAAIKRVVMKLREQEFSFGEFDHLYINFTTCDPAGEMRLSDKVDPYHPWYRYCNVAVEQGIYEKLGLPETHGPILDRIGAVVAAFFATEEFGKARILSCVHQAVEQGENMLMTFREKATTTRKAVIFLRYRDDCRFFPLLRVYDREGNLLLEKDLPESLTLDALGTVQLSQNRVTIKPRKNAYTTQSNPLVFDYPQSLP